MKLVSKKVLVTGAAGFVGSHLVERLIDCGCDVRSFVRYNSRNDIGLLREIPSEKRCEIEILAGDLRDSDYIRKTVKGVEVVFHLGSLIAIPYSYLHPREVIETNVIGTLNIMMAARDHGVAKVVHTSTSEVYGTARYVPIDEKHVLHGQSPYSASKIGADKIAESFYYSYGLPVATIRPFNIYGPRQSARAVIPTIITQALRHDKVRLGFIDSARDFTYVSDAVDAFVKIAECDRTIGHVFNIGCDREISVGELAKKIGDILSKKIKILTEKRRMRPEMSEVRRLCADSKRVRDLLGWNPVVSLNEGLVKTIEWIKNNLDRFDVGDYII